MGAGLGFKTFVTGDVLTAADTNGYLMQGTWVFASAAARDAAVTSPQEGNMCYLKDTDAVQYYSGSAWTAVGSSGGMTLLSTTTLSGASTNISVTSTGYNSLYVFVSGIGCSANADVYVQLNTVTGATDYINYSVGQTSNTARSVLDDLNGLYCNFTGLDGWGTGTDNSMVLEIPDPNGSKRKIMYFNAVYVGNTGTAVQFGMANANVTAAVTAIKFLLGQIGQTFSGGGTVKVYGVK